MSFIKSFFRPSLNVSIARIPSNNNEPRNDGPSPSRPHLADRREQRRIRREQRAA